MPTAAHGPRRPWLTRNVGALSAVSLAQDAASELMYPLLPVLLTTTLGAPAAVVGLIEGVAEGVAAVLKYVSGRVSDRIGRRPAVAAGYGLAALGKVLVAAAAAWPVVLAGRVVDRIGKGIRGAPRDALLADGVPEGALGRVFGFHRASDTLGAVIGPLLGLLVLRATGGDVAVALWVAVVPAMISVALVALTREAPRPRPPRASTAGGQPLVGPAAASPPATTHESRLPDRARALAAALGLVALVNVPDALILLRVSQVGFSPAEVVAAYALLNLTNALVAFPAGALSDRWPRPRVYALGLACFAVGTIGLAMVDGGWPVLALLAVYGCFAGITDGVGKAWMSALAPAHVRGHAQGLLQGLAGGGVLVAGLWAGLAWTAGPGSGVVPLALAGTVAGACGLALWVAGWRLSPVRPAG